MQTPSPDKSTQPQRREPLRWMAAAALLLAFLSICCVAQTVTFLLAPRNQRSNLDLRSKLLADYAPWNIDLPLPAIGPQVPAAQAADLATATSIALLGTSTPVIVGALPTSELAIVPPVANAPTPTLPGVGTVPPAPTATAPVIAGGGTTRTPTRGPTSTPTESDATVVDTPHPTDEPTPTDTRESQPSRTPTTAPATATTDKPDATNTPTPQPTNTPQPQPTNTPTPQPTNTSQPQPTNTPTPQPTNTSKPQPDKTNTPTPQPTNTPITPTPTPTNTPITPSPTPTNTPTSTPTPTNTPITPSPTPTNTPITPTPTPTDTPTPTPTVGTIDIVKAPSVDPATNSASFQYTLTITNNTGASIDVSRIEDTTDVSFTVVNCYDTQNRGSCSPPIGPGIPLNWVAITPVQLLNNASMVFVIEGRFEGVTPGSSLCNTSFTVTTSVGSVTRNNTACVTVN